MSDRFEKIEKGALGLYVLERRLIGDHRGYLERIFCNTELSELLEDRHVEAVNHTYTKHAGTVRGLHYQKSPHTETKIVSCTRGSVFDVAVDLRHNSPTFLQWYGEVLSAENHRSFYIPDGFAHGFQTLTDDVEMIYFHTAAYRPESEAGLNVSDQKLNIKWPSDIVNMSQRDQEFEFISDEFAGIK